MKFIVLISLLVSSLAHANCPDMAREALSKKKKTFPVTSTTYKDFYVALKDYRERMQPEFPARIEKVSGRFKGLELTGYEVEISDGGDESTFRYILNAKKKIVVAYWYNQSPMTYWFCGSKKVQMEDDTRDGDEIF